VPSEGPVELRNVDPSGEVLASLQQLTDSSLAYLPEEELLLALLERASEILRSDTAAILLLDDDGRQLRARAAKGIEEEVEQGVTIPLGKGFAGRIAAERRAIVIDDVDHADILNPILREKGIRSLLGVPLLVQGRVLGVLHVGSLTPRKFTDGECSLLQLAADRAALTIDNAALYEQRRLAESLQRELLPDVRVVPGLDLASRYLPASRDTLGGDWFDAFPLPRGRVAIAVGDVVGHGVAAAAAMAQLRSALRAYAVDGHPAAEVVERMNRLMWQLGPRAMTTLSYAIVDLEGESVEHVCAGHPPPLRIDADGTASFLEVVPNVPLAVVPATRFESTTHACPAGATLLLYTDGLVERRGETIDAGLERLRTSVEAPGDQLDGLCEQLVGALVPGVRGDDVAMIAVRVPSPPETISGRWPADRSVLGEIRQLMRRWLRRCGADEEETYDIVVAAQEACANAVEHAYGPGPQSFALECSYDAGRVRVTVRDEGRWRPPRGRHRGRGLMLMRRLMDEVTVDRGEMGTLVVLERRLVQAKGSA
jgi:anti-sigma regulatory factor (Ser/Thr protein kinase)/GAF domain-containing protein